MCEDGAEEECFRERTVEASCGRERRQKRGMGWVWAGLAGGAIYCVVGVCLEKMSDWTAVHGTGSWQSQADEAGEQASDERTGTTRKPDSGGRRGMWGRRSSGVSLHYGLPRKEVAGGTMSNFDLDRTKKRGREKRDVGGGVHVEARERDLPSVEYLDGVCRGHVQLDALRAVLRRDEEIIKNKPASSFSFLLFCLGLPCLPGPAFPRCPTLKS